MTIHGRNQIKNSSFDTAVPVAGEWILSNVVTAPDAIARTTTYAYTGTHSLLLTDTGAGLDVAVETDYDIRVSPEQRWSASAYLLGISGNTDVTFLVEYDDATTESRLISDVPTGFWGRRYMTFEIPDGVTKIVRLQILKGDIAPGTSPGVTAVDAVQLEIGPDPSSYFVPVAERDAGTMVTEDYQYEYNNFLFGHDTDFLVQSVQGLLGMPQTTAVDMDWVGDHGAAPGLARMSKRIIDIDLHLLGDPGFDIEDKIAWAGTCFRVPRIRSALASRELKPLVFQRPGQPKKMVYVRCDRREFTSTYDTAVGKASGAIQLVAPDPVIFSFEEHESSVALPAADLSESLTVYNAGDHPDGVRPVVRVTGPARNPRIKNEADEDRTLRLDLDIAADETLVIDLYTRDVRVEETADPETYVDAFDSVRTDNEWWNLLPGDNLITYTRDGTGLTGATSTLTVVYRDGWS